MTRSKIFFLLFTLVLINCPLQTYAKNEVTKPNIILVFIDDMGWADLSCFGNQNAKTPNIDRMAREGIAFEQFYVNSPICSPSRVAISTGQYPQRWNITSYLAHRKQNRKRGIANWLNPKAPMLARSLQKNGYATGHFGKWHMGGQRDVADAPNISEYGFDKSLTNFEGMGPKLLPLTMKPGWKEPGRIWEDAEILGKPVTWMQRSTITSGFVNASLKFIKKAEEANKAFYINVWPDDVHSPFFPPVENWGNNKRELYHSVLEEMDRQLGTLFEYIRNNKNLNNKTLILICSDNGHEDGAGQAGILKGCKTNLYEGGIRSPLIVWGPNLIKKEATGRRNHKSIFSAIDLVPSLLRLTRTTPPENIQYDGEDVLNTILGNSKESRKAPIFFSRPPDRKNYYGFKNLPDLAMRDGGWKFLCDYDGSRPQLYQLDNDPGETTNLAELHMEKVTLFTKNMLSWYQSVTPD